MSNWLRRAAILAVSGWVASGCGARTSVEPLGDEDDGGLTDGQSLGGEDGSGGSSQARGGRGNGGRSGSAGRRGSGGRVSPPDRCGNGITEPTESCDGLDLAGETCFSLTLGAQPNGFLACYENCTFDVSGCYATGAGGFGAGGFANQGGTSPVFGCGADACFEQWANAFFSLPACCVPGRPDGCGLYTGPLNVSGFLPAACYPRDFPGTLDPSCPATTVMGNFAAGCCAQGNQCGVDLSGFGLGCAVTLTGPNQSPQPCMGFVGP